MRRKFLLAAAIFLIFSSAALIFLSSADSMFFDSTGRYYTSKPVFAYYYGWYTKDAWYSGINGPSSLSVADVPNAGLYDSQNISLIDHQISQAVSAGINGFIASWWGPHSFTDNTDQILLNQASTRFADFTVTLYFETTIIEGVNPESQPSQIVSDVQYIMHAYGGSDVFTRIGGKDILFFSGVDNWPPSFWSNVTVEIHSIYPNLLLISDSLNVDYLNVFDGAASYVDLGYMTQSLPLLNGTYPTFTDISSLAASEGKFWFATASPGFNGTNDGKVQFPNVPRDSGQTFSKGWSIAQNSNPYGIIVGTWNEYYEGTSIEPAQSYGNLYVHLTAQLSAGWRAPDLPHYRVTFLTSRIPGQDSATSF